MVSSETKFPLLAEIDGQLNADSIDWNKNAFETLRTSNLPIRTVCYYAIDVGLRRLENSLYEAFWDLTADALSDLSGFLSSIPVTEDLEAYLYEARCQLLMYASIAMIKLNAIRRRSANEAKLSCATVCILLMEQGRSFETTSTSNEYASCLQSMRSRYLKRIFVAGQWLPTLSKAQLDDIQLHHEQYMTTMVDCIFPAVSLRDEINGFVEHCLLSDGQNERDLPDQDAITSGFVVIRRFPKLSEKTIEIHSDLMHMGLATMLNQPNTTHHRKLTYCLWALCCMIEADRVSLRVLNHGLLREHLSTAPIDFEEKPILMESLTELDMIVFLLLCAQQHTRLHDDESILHPYELYTSTHLYTPKQKAWWLTANEPTSSVEFEDHLATIRLDDDRKDQYPPKLILLRTAKILFRTAVRTFEEYSHRHLALCYEQYAIQYFHTAKKLDKEKSSRSAFTVLGNAPQKSFFRYAQLSTYGDDDPDENSERRIKRLVNDCEKLARQCDELKLLPEPEVPRVPSPGKAEPDMPIDVGSDPVNSKQEVEQPESIVESTITVPVVEETVQAPELPPIVDLIFTHITGVNQWMNRFYASNEGIQNDINTIRDRLENLNRATSQMIYSNVRIFQSSNANE